MTQKQNHAMGLYVHIPFCVKKCQYCDFPSFAGMEEIFQDYVEAVCTEMEMIHNNRGELPVDTIFYGGGTPSLLSVSQISKIQNTLFRLFRVGKNAEVTLEANPGTLTDEKAKAYKSHGFNRISLGLQAAQDELLQFMGRIHTRKMFLHSIDLIKNYGFTNINADIIFGVPYQSMENWIETLMLVINMGMTHISCYSLNIEKNTSWYDMNKRGELPLMDDDMEREMYYKAIFELEQAGFHHYEVSNFTLNGYESKHNLKYWSGKPYIGIGAAAHSFFENKRIGNCIHPTEYIRSIQNGLSPQAFSHDIGLEERLSERLILGLRCIEGVSLCQLSEEFGNSALAKYRGKIEVLKRRNLICIEGSMMKLTKKGLDYANQVWMEFL